MSSIDLVKNMDLEEYYLSMVKQARKSGDQLVGLCPFHDDHNPSLSVNMKTGQWCCHAGCGGGGLVQFHARIHGMETKGAYRDLLQKYGGDPNERGAKAVPENHETQRIDLDQFRDLPPKVLGYLKEKRGWSEEMIRKYKIKYDAKSERIVIPIDDGHGNWVNVRKYKPNANESKMVSYKKGYGQARLWPPSTIEDARRSESRLIVLTEGEPDTLCGLSRGIPCITQTGGAGTWRPEFNPNFEGLNVLIAYDNDLEGKAGAGRVAKSLFSIASSVRILVWPQFMANKQDLTDFFVTYGKTIEDFWHLAQIEYAEAASPEGNSILERFFPRIEFPWTVLPPKVAESIKELARSCATSPHPLVGAALALYASTLGRTAVVSAKASWDAPLIVWHIDIRESGEGKTAPARMMAQPIHEAQAREFKRYTAQMRDYKSLPKKLRDETDPPRPPRGYFVSDFTVEGLRDDMVDHPHGGILVIQDEVSAFLTGQNQYKAKGTDREACLALHDGNPARVSRAGRSVLIIGARVSIFGGTQPRVFSRCFGGDDGIFLADGTLFRFLLTYDGPAHYDLTQEAWTDEHRQAWESPLDRAMRWADEKVLEQNGTIEKPYRMILNTEAAKRFFDWRNELNAEKTFFPEVFRGFLPKAFEYCLRLAGIIHMIWSFSEGQAPQMVLGLVDIERGIRTVEFYLGQTQSALSLLLSDEDNVPEPPLEISERTLHLAKTLAGLRTELDQGRLAIGYVHEEYAKTAAPQIRFASARSMGCFLRSLRLRTTPGKHDANGRRGVHCLQWDKNTDRFLETCLRRPQRPETEDSGSLPASDINFAMSAKSALQIDGYAASDMVRTSDSQNPEQKRDATQGITDFADFAEVASVPNDDLVEFSEEDVCTWEA